MNADYEEMLRNWGKNKRFESLASPLPKDGTETRARGHFKNGSRNTRAS